MDNVLTGSVKVPPHLSCHNPATNSSFISNPGALSMNSFNNDINRNNSTQRWTSTRRPIS